MGGSTKLLSKRYFQKNKNKNIVTVLAIVLTTIMFTTLFVLSQSMSRNLVEMTFRQTGYDAQVSFPSITDEQIKKLAAHPDVEEPGRASYWALQKIRSWQQDRWKSAGLMRAMRSTPLQCRKLVVYPGKQMRLH